MDASKQPGIVRVCNFAGLLGVVRCIRDTKSERFRAILEQSRVGITFSNFP
jgi:hypothetical protein